MKLNSILLGAVLCTPLCTPLPALAQTALRLPSTVTLAPMNDPWPAAQERWWDIDNNPFNDWITNGQPNGKFSYANAQVKLTFDRAPGVPYFVGHIVARGLKPNFAYQLKLLGKPQRGSRGWGTLGDDVSNERIGYVARWWDDTLNPIQTNFDDQHYLDNYKNAAPGEEHDIYGYQFMGDIVTDSQGNADVAISGEFTYHITWASWQYGWRDVTFGTFPVQGGALPGGGFYGYGPQSPTGEVTLYYENQWGRTNPVILPDGLYKSRFVITEETFHNDGFGSPLGGYWKGVLASEDYDALGRPDTNPANDVTFTIGAHAPQIGTMSPQAALDNPGTAREFAVIYNDADDDLHYIYFQIGSRTRGLQCLYNVRSRKLYLRDDNDQNWLGGFAAGAPRIISNSRGQLNCAATRVETVPNGVRMRWNVTATPNWAVVPQAVQGFARDRIGLMFGWKALGTWIINQPPDNRALSPQNGVSAAGTPKTVTSVHRDPNGGTNIRYVMMHVGTGQSAPGALRCYYNAVQNRLYLLNDDGTTYQGGFPPGSDHIISNSQGSLDCEATTISYLGNTLSVNWSLTPAQRWAGSTRDVWLFTIDRANAYAPWQKKGTWRFTG